MVEDSGTGMSETVRKRLFEPFFTTREVGEGSGLGLSIVHGIVKNHNGAIRIESSFGTGTSVFIYLPVLKATEIDRINRQELEIAYKKRILVVDDESTLAQFYNLALKKIGYDVIKCNSSIKALEIFKNQPDQIDLVLTDQIMPEMNGIQLCEAIHKINPKIPIVLITGHPGLLSPEKIESDRVVKVIHKPIKIRKLVQQIQKALAGEIG